MVADQKRSWRARLIRRIKGSEQVERLEAPVRELARKIERLEATVHELAQKILDRQYEVADGDRYNLYFELERLALHDSARLVEQHMPKAAAFWHPHQTLGHALSLAPRGGLALEFGVFSGKTLTLIADARGDGRVWGFDSFEGLPEDWRTNYPAGSFSAKELPQVPGAELVVGWFDQTLPGFLEDHPGTVDFLHIDCDLYSSTRTVLDLVGPRLRPGSIIMFDEFFSYPGWREHEFKAWNEYVEQSGTSFTFEAYTINNQQIALRITGARTAK